MDAAVKRRQALALMGLMGGGGLGAVLGGCSKKEVSLAQLIEQARGIAVGNPAGKPLVVFFDTRCGYCVRLWQTLQPQQADLSMLWVPVALLAPASEEEALTLLASANPQAALLQHMQPFGHSPAASPASGFSDELRQALRSNREALNDVSGRESVPQSVAQGEAGLKVATGAQPWPRLREQLAL